MATLSDPLDRPAAARAPAAAGSAPDGRGLVDVSVSLIVPSLFQARKDFAQGSLDTLADSIRRTGLMQPVVLRRSTRGAGGYELVAGERRWRAAKLAGLARVPAVVRELTDEQAAEWGVVENVQREDLNPIERAWAYRMMGERFKLTQEQIAERVGQERSTVANAVRLTELEPAVQDMIAAGRLTAGHGRALLGITSGLIQVNTAKEVAAQGRSVRYVERMVGEYVEGLKRLAEGKPVMMAADPKIAARETMERRLSERLGTKVVIRTRGDGKAGRIVISFFGLDQFDGVCAKMGVGEG